MVVTLILLLISCLSSSVSANDEWTPSNNESFVFGVLPALDPPPGFSLPLSPIDPLATFETRAIWRKLVSLFGRKTLSGICEASNAIDPNSDFIHLNTSSLQTDVTLRAFDLMDQYADHDDPNMPIERMLEWAAQGGIVALQWQWRDPLNHAGSFYSSGTTFRPSVALRVSQSL